MSVRGGGPHGGEGPRYTQRPEISTYSRDVQCLSSPPPTSFSSSLSSFLPWSVPLVSLALALSREGLYSPYFCVVITRRTDHGRIYALFQIDLLYLILTPSRRPLLPQLSLEGVDAFARTLSFFFFDRSISTGVPAARTLSSFFLSIPKEFLFVGGGEITGIDRSPRDNASIPFFVSRFLHEALRSLLFNPSLRLYRCWGSSQIRGGTNEVRDVL